MSAAQIGRWAGGGATIGLIVGTLACCWITWMRSLFPLPIHGAAERIAFSLCPFLWMGWMPWHHGIPLFYITVVVLNTLLYAFVFAACAGILKLIRSIAHSSRVESRP